MTDHSKGKLEGRRRTQKIKLRWNNDSYPMLPSIENIEGHELLYKKQLISRFIGNIQWLKKPSQCLAILKGLTCHK